MKRHEPVFDTESLQSDVMRFMAIIAFCLIAILTLVDKRAGKSLATVQMPTTTSPSGLAQAKIENHTERKRQQPTNLVDHIPSPEQSENDDVKIEQETATPTLQVTGVNSSPLKPDNKEQGKVTANAAPKPLILRFASEELFLNSIVSGELELYIQQSTGFQKLDESFTFVPDKPSGLLYQILPGTVPLRIRRLAGSSNVSAYLVRLPPQVHKHISSLASRHSKQGGTIVIDSYSEVFYES